MALILIYAVFLFAATLLSARIQRSILSTAVIFLLAGLIAGPSGLNVTPQDKEMLEAFVEVAMFTVLYTDGMRVDFSRLRTSWQLPALALGIGMPLTIAFTAWAAHATVGMEWPQAFLLGSILSPTDPVFASALVGRKEVPRRLRDLLNVESGLNDGLALPAVWISLALVAGTSSHWQTSLLELVEGVALGIAVPWLAIHIERLRPFAAAGVYQIIRGFAIGLLVFALASLTGANVFLAGFAAGVTVASLSDKVKHDFRNFGETGAELTKLAGIMGFGAFIPPRFFWQTTWASLGFVLLTLVVVRPLAIGPTLLGSRFTWKEAFAAMWFGPKGFATVFYSIFVLQRASETTATIVHLAAMVVMASMIAHPSTDLLVANWLKGEQSSDGNLPGFGAENKAHRLQ
jgi:NhaP-type Na+/H+ or K+/H+ antiporter